MLDIAKALGEGWNIHQSGKTDQALAIYDKVIDQKPQNPEAHVYRGIALFDLRRFDEAIEAYQTALKLRDQFPIAWNNLGNAFRMVGEIDQSDSCFETALKQDPKYLSAIKNRGTLWVWAGELERGLSWYQKGLQLAPQEPELHRNLGVIYLLLGDYQRGWPEYRWRWSMPGMQRMAGNLPLWTGQDLSGKRVLLFPEQGRGDEIQFVRMASQLSSLGAHVYMVCDKPMIPLFTSVAGVAGMLPTGESMPPIHFQSSLIDAVDSWYQRFGELPYGLDGFETHPTAGYINVSQPLTDYWGNWLHKNLPVAQGLEKPPLRVGIAWQGNPEHHADVYRSIALEQYRPLVDDPEIELVSLQFGFGSEQLEQVDFGDQVLRLPKDTDATGGAFTDTAAVLKNLDHVLTTDTSLAHLSGALQVPTTVLLGKIPDWRWLQKGGTTQWYPSMRLVRQTELGDWETPVKQAHQAIKAGV